MYDYRSAWKSYLAKQARLHAAGMPENDIACLQAFDKEELRSDRRYYGRISRYITTSAEIFPTPMPENWGLDVLDSIESPALYRALRELKEDERRIIFLHVVDGLPLKCIAGLWGKPYDTLAKQYKRAVKKLKKFL